MAWWEFRGFWGILQRSLTVLSIAYPALWYSGLTKIRTRRRSRR
ncbi:TPA: hypothetical protein ACLRI5_000765 [Neisseria meningitidis]|nr:hypothetical protein [Neisseria meningitidis]